MIVCEYFYKPFDARGSNEYLNAWATEVDLLAAEGWQVLDSKRRQAPEGWWTVVLARPAREFGRAPNKSDRSAGAGEAESDRL